MLQGMERENACVTHGKPCVTRHEKENACVTHGKPCVHMHANGHAYKMGGQFVEKGGAERKGEGKRKGREMKERKRERRRKKGEKEGEKEICVPMVGTHRTKK